MSMLAYLQWILGNRYPEASFSSRPPGYAALSLYLRAYAFLLTGLFKRLAVLFIMFRRMGY